MAVDVGQVGVYGTPATSSLLATSKVGNVGLRFTEDLRKKESYAERQMTLAYGKAFAQVEKEMEALATRVQEGIAKGQFSPSWAMQDDRYKALLRQYSDAIKSFDKSVTSQVAAVQSVGVQAALDHTPQMARDYMGGKAPTGVKVPDFGPETWGTINKAAYAKAVGFLGHHEAPLRQLIDKLGLDTRVAVQAEWAKGFGLGYNPKKIARNIKDATANIALGRARTIARTEFHRAYRMTQREQFMQSDVIKGWVWHANLDLGTCAVCISEAGSQHPAFEILDGHPNCRCTMLPLTKTWGELGFPGVAGDVPLALGAQKGSTFMLNKLGTGDTAGIKRILGQHRGQDFIDRVGHEGMANVSSILRSYVHQTSHPLWGPGKKLAPFGRAPGAPGKARPAPKAPPPPTSTGWGSSRVPKALDDIARRAKMGGDQFKADMKNKLTSLFTFGDKDGRGLHRTDHVYSHAAEAKANIQSDLSQRILDNPEYAGAWADSQIVSKRWWQTGVHYKDPRYISGQMTEHDIWMSKTQAERIQWMRDDFATQKSMAAASGSRMGGWSEDVSDLIQSWSYTSGDSSMRPIALQKAVHDVFGLPDEIMAHWGKMGFDPTDMERMERTMYAEDGAAFRAFVKVQYENTQELLRGLGVDSVDVMRAVGGSRLRSNKSGDIVDHTLQPASSYAISTLNGEMFGSSWLYSEVPADWILSTARTGFGCLGEWEVTVIGRGPVAAYYEDRNAGYYNNP